jgi:hypothetical protein
LEGNKKSDTTFLLLVVGLLNYSVCAVLKSELLPVINYRNCQLLNTNIDNKQIHVNSENS